MLCVCLFFCSFCMLLCVRAFLLPLLPFPSRILFPLHFNVHFYCNIFCCCYCCCVASVHSVTLFFCFLLLNIDSFSPHRNPESLKCLSFFSWIFIWIIVMLCDVLLCILIIYIYIFFFKLLTCFLVSACVSLQISNVRKTLYIFVHSYSFYNPANTFMAYLLSK